MNIQKRREIVIKKLFENALRDEVTMQVAVEIKETMLLKMKNEEIANKIIQAITMERMELKNQAQVIMILERKVKECTSK